jgi:hypothetical protein
MVVVWLVFLDIRKSSCGALLAELPFSLSSLLQMLVLIIEQDLTQQHNFPLKTHTFIDVAAFHS